MQRAQAPTAERTVNPTGASTESLTSNPELENSLSQELKYGFAFNSVTGSGQFVQERLGVLEVRRIKPFSEPILITISCRKVFSPWPWRMSQKLREPVTGGRHER
jgi:hypothetical protein